jgi:hypothetical protein
VSDGIAGFLAITTGPRRLRSRLLRATRPIRRSRRALARIGGVRGSFPAEVFGGDLLAVLGAHLRGLIETAAVAEEAPALQRLARRLARPDVIEHRGIYAPSVAATGAVQGPSPMAAFSAEWQRVPPARAASSGASRPARPVWSWTDRGGRRTSRFERNTVLEDRLRRYWQAEHVAQLRTGARAGPVASRAAAASLPEPVTGAPASPRFTNLTEAELARELEAFVDGRSVIPDRPSAFRRDAEPAPQTPTAWVAVPPGAAASPIGEAIDGGHDAVRRNLARAAVRKGEPGRRAPDLSGLAEDMAAILREQAIRHGIDVP